MAFLTDGNFYAVTFLPLSDAAWSSLAPTPGTPAALGAFLYGTPTPVVVFVTDAALGSFVYPGGEAFDFDDTLIDSVTAAFTLHTLIDVDGAVMYWGVDGSGTVWRYDVIQKSISSYSPASIAAFKAFLP